MRIYVTSHVKVTLIPYEFILCISPQCHTLSKAFEKSQNTKQLNSVFSSEFEIGLYN